MRNKTSSAQKKSSVMRTPKIKKVKGFVWEWSGKSPMGKFGFSTRKEYADVAMAWGYKPLRATLHIEL